MSHPLRRRLPAEYLGSAFLAALVIGSGIAAQQPSPDDTGLALLENAAATAASLYAIILMFGPVSGGHFNPVVSLVDAHFGGLSRRDALAYIPRPGRRVRHRRDRRERDVRPGRDQHLDPRPASIPGFVVAQLVGGVVAVVVIKALYPDVTPAEAADVVLPRSGVHGLDRHADDRQAACQTVERERA